MTQPLVSIVIPVFNVERHLRQCLDSVLRQTLKEWECICIDDGSPDGSGAILDEYGNKDARFKSSTSGTGAFPPHAIWASNWPPPLI